MRYNNRVTLVNEGERVFNPKTGNMESIGTTRKVIPARVNDMSDERIEFLFGNIQSQAYTIVVMGSAIEDNNYVEINGKPYTIKRVRRLRNKTTMDVVAQ